MLEKSGFKFFRFASYITLGRFLNLYKLHVPFCTTVMIIQIKVVVNYLSDLMCKAPCTNSDKIDHPKMLVSFLFNFPYKLSKNTVC